MRIGFSIQVLSDPIINVIGFLNLVSGGSRSTCFGYDCWAQDMIIFMTLLYTFCHMYICVFIFQKSFLKNFMIKWYNRHKVRIIRVL
uniref:Uncharacterized protein n=1 Tax=Picea sitchensis TaxID=3332 RepID=D5AE73_PICSI|nr:unknown [Picea sitchensis]